MHLTPEEQAWLQGEADPATQRAIEIIVALGKIYGAERLIPVQSVQISGVSYRNIGAAGLDFLHRWAEEGARVRVPTTLNPTAMDLQAWQQQGFAADFAHKQLAVVDIFARMGVNAGQPTPTCTPYLIGNCPPAKAHIAWAESSAVSYANSVLGARSNREGGPGAIAAAITGRTADYGLHLETQRRATMHVEVKAQPQTISDYSALGAIVGRATQKDIPYFTGLRLTNQTPQERAKLKALGAAMAATGAVALYYIEAITPQAPIMDKAPTLVIHDITPGYTQLSDEAPIDLVWIGCPHASLDEIKIVADSVHSRTLRLPLWITSARPVQQTAIQQELAAPIEAAGGQLFADACMAIAPVRALGFRAVATPSAKGAYYLRNLANVATRFAPLETCIEIALA